MPPKLEIQTEVQLLDKAAEKKERKRLEKEDRTIFLKKEHLRREIELGARNLRRFRKPWREMVMKMRMPNIKEDLEVAWHTFDRALDIKDYSISLLLDAINNAEEQYQMNERAHIEQIDQFIEIYKTRLANEEDSYHLNLDELLTEAESETNKINYQHAEDDVFLQAMIFAMKQRLDESLSNVKSATFTKVESQTEDLKNLRKMEMSFMSKNLKHLWRDLQDIVSDYMKKTKDRRRVYEVLKEKDDTERKIIDHQVVRTATLFEEIRKFKEKIANFKSMTEKQIAAIMKERNFFQEAYWTAKNRFLEEQMTDKNQFRIMASEYNRTTQHLNQLIKKLESILIIMQICRKYETQDEKIVPFAIPVEVDESETLISLDWTRSSEIVKEIQHLENFWRRAGTAQIILTELKQERDILRKETNHLRQCLKSYISEGAVEEVPKTVNFEK